MNSKGLFQILMVLVISAISMPVHGQIDQSITSETTTTTTTTGLTGETTTTTTYSILRSIYAQPDQSDFTQGTIITIFSDRTLNTNYQNLYVEISSLYGEESTLGMTYYDLKPLKDGLNLANSIKEGVIDVSVSEDVDVDYENIDIMVNDGPIKYIESQYFPIYKYGKYRELPSIYNNDENEKYIEDITNFLPTAVDTTTELIKEVKKIPIPLVGPLLNAISMSKDTRKALDDIGWLPHVTVGSDIDETERMTKRYTSILNDRDIIEVPWNAESDWILFSKAYESVVIKIPLLINNPKDRVIYIHGMYICESPTPQSGKS